MLDHTESPFWAADEEANARFGYHIDMNALGLSEKTRLRIRSLTNLYAQRLNPVCPMFPSFWSGRMHVSFQVFVTLVYGEIETEMKGRFELINGESALMTAELDLEQIDSTLAAFMNNPSAFADQSGIHYRSARELEEELQAAYRDWKKTERWWTTI